MTALNIQPHELTEACLHTHCFWHEIDESSEGAFIWCNECGHVYPTARSLRKAYRRAYWQLCGGWSKPFGQRGWTPSLPARLWRMATVRAKSISFCQECVHDF